MKTILIACFVLLSTITVFAQKQQPNIIMIAVDDLNDWIGAYGGHPQVKTPNIDKLAQKSMVFRNASCPGPVCGPSRSALLSGFMPSTTGVYGNSTNMLHSEIVQTNTTLPEYFTKHGYLTLSSGKIFHAHKTDSGSDNGQWAFDIWNKENGSDGGVREDKMYSSHWATIDGKKIENPQYVFPSTTNDMHFGPTKGGKETMLDYKNAKWAEMQLQKSYDKPFFMSIGISKPHLPFVVPQEFFDLYGLDTIKVPEIRMDDLDDIVDKNGKKIYQAQTTFLWAKHYGLEKEVVRAYMASISFADACVGVILDAIEKSEYADNTIIMLWGDHGWHLGEKLKYGKATLWRESTQLPFLIHLPKMKSKQECYRNVNLIDIYPTLIDLCNLPKKQLDGKSIKPLLKNPTKEWTPTVSTLNKGNHSVMSEKWHYIRIASGAEELYNLETDPMEWHNLANNDTPEVNAVKKNLSAYLPTINADAVKSDPSSGSDSETNENPNKDLDVTIKSKRNLQELK